MAKTVNKSSNLKEIQSWLDSDKDYQAGLILFEKYSKTLSMIHYLKRKQNQEKLERELKKLLGIISEKELRKSTSNESGSTELV